MSVGSSRDNIKVKRIFTHPVNAPGCHSGKNAVASLCELNARGEPHMGNAGMKVYNVVPGNGVVIVRGEVDWDEPLTIRISVIYQ